MRRTMIVPTLILLVLTGCGSLNRQLAEAKNDLTIMRTELTRMSRTVTKLAGSIESIDKNTKRAATAVEGSRDDLRTAFGLPALTSE